MRIYLLFFFLISTLFSCSKDDNSNIEKETKLPSTDDVCTKMEDINFMKYCYDNFDANKDGKVSETEAASVNKIIINSNKQIISFKGLEYFYNVTDFTTNANSIKSFAEVKSLKKLKNLTLNRTDGFENLDVTLNSDLEVLDCAYSNIKNINIANLTKLKRININSNSSIYSLDISKTPNISDIYVGYSSLQEVVLKKSQDNVTISKHPYENQRVINKKYVD